MSKAQSGWAWPLNLPKAHYFHNDARSLCHRVLYLGSQLEEGKDDSPDNCAECKKRLKKMRAALGAVGEEQADG